MIVWIGVVLVWCWCVSLTEKLRSCWEAHTHTHVHTCTQGKFRIQSDIQCVPIAPGRSQIRTNQTVPVGEEVAFKDVFSVCYCIVITIGSAMKVCNAFFAIIPVLWSAMPSVLFVCVIVCELLSKLCCIFVRLGVCVCTPHESTLKMPKDTDKWNKTKQIKEIR